MSRLGKGKKAVPFPKKKDAATAACRAMNKEAEDANIMVNGSCAAVVCYFSNIMYFLSMRFVPNRYYI
jgi:hypothetical protein